MENDMKFLKNQIRQFEKLMACFELDNEEVELERSRSEAQCDEDYYTHSITETYDDYQYKKTNKEYFDENI